MGGGRVERGGTRREGGVCVCVWSGVLLGGWGHISSRMHPGANHPPAAIIEKKSNVICMLILISTRILQTHCNQMVC